MPASQFPARVVDNRELSGGYFALRLASDIPHEVGNAQPGQFVMVRGDWGRDLVNPRAFSVLDVYEDGSFAILGKVSGRGTAKLGASRIGDRIVVTGPLGRAFALPQTDTVQLLVAGGVGLPPLFLQAKAAAAAGCVGSIELFYGGRSRDDLVLLDAMRALGVTMVLATEDGSLGERGFVTAPLERRLEAQRASRVEILACGPKPMLEAVRTLGLARECPTYLCLEEEMACGFGVCLGCAVPVYGSKPYAYCCTDGPVFAASEVRWP